MIEVVWETIPPFVLCVVYVVLCVFRMFKIRVLANIETKEFERIEKISCKIITDREGENSCLDWAFHFGWTWRPC